MFTTQLDRLKTYASKHHAASLAGAGVVGALAGVGVDEGIRAIARRKRSKRKSSRKRNYKRSARKTNHYRKKTRRSHARSNRKAIRHTKTGQPYIILASGKARFISKRSARTRKSRKGGYY